MVLLSGCAGSSFGPSAEWRLRNLEKNFLEFQDNQLERDARLAALEERMGERMGGGMEEAMGGPSKGPDRTAPGGRAVQPEEGPDTAPKPHLLKSGDISSPHQAAKEEQKEAEAKSWEDYPAPGEVSEEPMREDAKEPLADAKKPQTARAAMDQGQGEYDSALKLVLAGEAKKGRAALTGFMEKYPRSPLMPNAVYWTGETYYSEKRYAQAVLTFKQVHQKFPKHAKAAAALLKIGYAYERLGDRNNARFYLDALVQDYPGSEPAASARKTLKALSR